MKRCPKCDTQKDETEFHKRGASKDGYQYECKECQVYSNLSEDQKDKRDIANKGYRKTEEGKRTHFKSQKKWRATNRGHLLTSISNRKSAANRYRRDPEYIHLKNRAYKAGVPIGVLKQVRERDKVCQLCSATEDLQFAHIYPVSLGGLGSLKNLQLLCGPCNNFKSDNLFLPGGGMLVTPQRRYNGWNTHHTTAKRNSG